MKRLRVAAFVAFGLLCVLIHWRAGTYHSEFGRYPDEGMHYVTGLMIRDFAFSGQWLHPMSFARDYYAHFPKVAIGNWPPVFETLQAAWGVLFGVSRVSMLLLVQLMAVLMAVLVFVIAAPRVGTIYAALAGAMLIASPLTQYVSSMVMAEVPVALFSLLAVLAWIRFQSTRGTAEGVWFGVWTMLAIMTKGNGWVIPVIAALAILLTRDWKLLRTRGLWLAIVIVVAICGPYTLLTMRIVKQGWNSQSLPDAHFLIASVGVHARFAAGVLGLPLTLVVAAGAVWRTLVPWIRRAKTDIFWLVMAIYGVVIVLFHAVVPTSIEPRKIYQIAPVLCLFLAAALDDLVRALPPRPLFRVAIPAAAALLFCLTGFSLLPPFAPGFIPAIQALQARDDTSHAAVLLASNPVFDDFEAALISEWASRRRDTGTYLLRATKILSRVVDAGGAMKFIPLDSDPAQLNARLASIPVAYVLVDTSTAAESYPHHALLLQTLESHPEDWEPVYSAHGSAIGRQHEIRIFRNRKDLRGVPVHFDVDLTRKIGDSIEVEHAPVLRDPQAHHRK